MTSLQIGNVRIEKLTDSFYNLYINGMTLDKKEIINFMEKYTGITEYNKKQIEEM